MHRKLGVNLLMKRFQEINEYKPRKVKTMQPMTNSKFNPQDFTNYENIVLKSHREAIGLISFLLHFDQRLKSVDFSLVMNEVYSIVMNDNYTIIGRKLADDIEPQPVAVMGWGNFNQQTLTLRSNNIRPLSPYEYESGKHTLITLFSSPFDTPEGILEFVRSKSQKLQQVGEVSFLPRTFTDAIII